MHLCMHMCSLQGEKVVCVMAPPEPEGLCGNVVCALVSLSLFGCVGKLCVLRHH